MSYFSSVLKANPYHDEIGRFATHAGAKFVSLWGKKNIVAAASASAAKPKSNSIDLLKPAAPDRKYISLAHANKEFEAHSKKQIAALSSTEQAEVVRYTGPSYGPLNRALRSGSALNKVQMGMQRNLDSAIAKSIAGKDIEVSRGLRVTDSLQGLLQGDAKGIIGTVFQDKSFVSTTTLKNDPLFEGGLRMVIQVGKEKNALYVDQLSENPGERELILPRNSKFLVRKIEDSKNSYGSKIRILHMTLL